MEKLIFIYQFFIYNKKLYTMNMHLKRVDVNISRVIRIENWQLGIIRETKNGKLLKSVLPNHEITLVTTNWSKTTVKAKCKVTKLIN